MKKENWWEPHVDKDSRLTYFPNFKPYFIKEWRQALSRAGFPDVDKQPKDHTN